MKIKSGNPIASSCGLLVINMLDTQPPVSPQDRIFWGSREEWSCEDALPVYAEYRPEK